MTVSWFFFNHRIREELRCQRAQYRQLIQNIPEVVWRATEKGDAVFISERISEVFGYTPDEVLRRGSQLWFGRMHLEDRDRVMQSYTELFKGGEKFDVHYRIQHRDGHWMWWHDRAQLAIDGATGKKYADGLLSDVTQVKELEAYLQQSQKMEAIGQLAGGIAHDFNNLLQVITGYAELVEGCIEQDSRARRHMTKIKGAADRAKSLTEQLLGFSRKQLQQLTPLNLNEAVSQFEPILRQTLSSKVEMVLRLSVAPTLIVGDQAQIQQILTNMALNARDAMPTGGDLVIETGHITIDEAYMRTHTRLACGDYVLLSISDTGTGMDAHTLSHIFEPFFTTKPKGKGRGLGLATVYGIVKQSGGEILVNSEPGHGTCFRIYFPAAAHRSEHVPSYPEAKNVNQGTETILLAEDEPGVRDLACILLEDLGYRVHSAPDGEAALNFAARFDGSIHLLLTDMVMPGCSGTELAHKLGRRRPSIKVLYMSGYTEDKLLRLHLHGNQTSILRKPFTKDQLAFAVQKAIDGPSFAEVSSRLGQIETELSS